MVSNVEKTSLKSVVPRIKEATTVFALKVVLVYMVTKVSVSGVILLAGVTRVVVI